jgi:SRSO17 transposase|tara:strand:- start:90 stop:1496 length:1407 start_codon:yes stop_codon:yes gene_type:complete
MMEFEFELTADDIGQHAQDLLGFHEQFSEFYRTSTRNASPQALEYLKGQLLCESRRNMSQMSVRVTNMNEQALSNFISTSPWQDVPLIEAIGAQSVCVMSSCEPWGANALILDESGIGKQGHKSVGVSRQYCGALGKVDNCQMGVFLAYSTPEQATLIDRRLFLPEAWVEDPERCEEAGIPKDAQVFHTKAELGLEMILQAKQREMPFAFVGMDAHYGQQPWLLTRLERENLVYMADIPQDTRVYLTYPNIGVPKRKGSRGRPPSKPRVLHGEAVEVRNLIKDVSLRRLKVRQTQRGELRIRFAALRVFRIEDDLPLPKPVWLLIRQELDTSETKFSFSNAPASIPLKTLAEWQSRRYWVERALQDAKGLAGLDEYQVIGWRGWHHHMTMVLLAMLFLLQLKQTLRSKAPLITLQDAVEILEVVLPKKQLTFEEAVEHIRDKHLNRLRSRNSRLRSQKVQLKAVAGFS